MKNRLIERAHALRATFHNMKSEEGKLINSSDPWAEHIYALLEMVHLGLYNIERFQSEFPQDPREALRSEILIQKVCLIEFLTPRLEKWVNNEVSSENTVITVSEFCKNRVMSGDMTNTIAPLDRLISAMDYKNYCEIFRVLNDLSKNKKY